VSGKDWAAVEAAKLRVLQISDGEQPRKDRQYDESDNWHDEDEHEDWTNDEPEVDASPLEFVQPPQWASMMKKTADHESILEVEREREREKTIELKRLKAAQRKAEIAIKHQSQALPQRARARKPVQSETQRTMPAHTGPVITLSAGGRVAVVQQQTASTANQVESTAEVGATQLTVSCAHFECC